jgi:glycosyltransferase involved in cell wall biosynthesis
MTAIAFHAPLKRPGHPTPSGDREIARLFLRLFRALGFDAEIASELRTFDVAGDGAFQARTLAAAEGEVARLAASLGARPAQERPALWFTYHVYYKAPDLIGPRIARALSIPYVVAEGSRAGKRSSGPWRLWHEAAEAALDAADLIVTLNPADEPALLEARPPGQDLVTLPPFLDPADWPRPVTAVPRRQGEDARLLTVAMMRQGDKLSSYRMLASALKALPARGWRLDVVGDGPARGEVEALFAPLGPRVRFHGLVEDREALAEIYARSDLLLWPAVNEAFGMVFLEAARQGCPALACAYGGVGAIVRDGETGRLTPPGDVEAFAAAARDLVASPRQRERMGVCARGISDEEHSLGAAAARLGPVLRRLAAKTSIGSTIGGPGTRGPRTGDPCAKTP